MVFIHGQAVLVLQDLPAHRVGDEVAVVGLHVAVAVGGLRAVEFDLAGGELDTVFIVDAVNNDLCRRGNGRVLGGVFLDLVKGVLSIFLLASSMTITPMFLNAVPVDWMGSPFLPLVITLWE